MNTNKELIDNAEPMKDLRSFVNAYVKTHFTRSGLSAIEMRGTTYKRNKEYRTLEDDCAPTLRVIGAESIWSQAQRQRPSDSDAQLRFKLTDVPDAPPSDAIPLHCWDPGDKKHLELGYMSQPQMARYKAYLHEQEASFAKTAEQVGNWIELRIARGIKPDDCIFDWLEGQLKRK